MVVFLGLIKLEFINQHNLFLSNYIHNLFPILSQIETFLREISDIDIYFGSQRREAQFCKAQRQAHIESKKQKQPFKGVL